MGTAKLGNLTFRLDPDQIQYAYQVDYSTIDTIGGQVIQVLGATIGDITINGSLGQDHKNKKDSWQLANSFHAQIKSMIDAQTSALRNKQGQGTGAVHQPVRFTYHDGVHNWDFKVLIKAIADNDGGSLTHRTGKMNYQYQLTLFLVEDASLVLKKITTDKFIARISNGMGWKPSGFNGITSLDAAIKFIQSNSTDGSINGYFVNLLQGQVKLDPAQTAAAAAKQVQTGGGVSLVPPASSKDASTSKKGKPADDGLGKVVGSGDDGLGKVVGS